MPLERGLMQVVLVLVSRVGRSKRYSLVIWAGCKLAGSGSSVPEAVLSNTDLEKLVDTNDEWIASRTGIRCALSAAARRLASRSGA